MFVKTFRYRVLPTQMDKYLAVQERAARLYQTDADHQAIYLQSSSDPCQWMEIHRYRDEVSWQRSAARLGAIAEFRTLWNEFSSTLDPAFPSQMEDYHQRSHFAGDGLAGSG